MRRELRKRRDCVEAVIDRKGVGYWKGRAWDHRVPRMMPEFDFDAVKQNEAPVTCSVGLIVATVETVRVHPLPVFPEVLYRRVM